MLQYKYKTEKINYVVLNAGHVLTFISKDCTVCAMETDGFGAVRCLKNHLESYEAEISSASTIT